MKFSKPILTVVLFLMLTILFLYMAGFFTAKLPQQQHTKMIDTSNWKTIILVPENIMNERQFVGIVSAQQKAILSARITARIGEVLVDVGDEVEQGDVLIRLEGAALNAIVRQAEQALSSVQAQLNVARKEFQRSQQLLNKKLISQAQFEQVESQFKTQNANFERAKATVEEAETTYGYSLITAPFTGVIDTRLVNVGDTAAPGMALLSLYNPQTLQLQANISESLVNKAMLNKILRYEIPNFAIKGKGQVVNVSPATDNSSHSFVVKIALNDPQQLLPGSYGNVWIETEKNEVITVPSEAIFQIGQLDYVKVLENEEIKTKLIQLGENNRVRKGLKIGDVLILNPLNYNN